jgi:hypothetical protein
MINRQIPGQMTDTELGRLIELARMVPTNGIIVEVGCLYGLSSWHLAKHCAAGATVFCIDPWCREQWIIELVEQPQQAPIFSRAAFESFVADCSNMVIIQGRSPQVARGWQLPVDLYFDDAVHINPVLNQNISFWTHHVRQGGVISGHDYCLQWPDVALEADRLAENLGSTVQIVGTVWSVIKPVQPMKAAANLAKPPHKFAGYPSSAAGQHHWQTSACRKFPAIIAGVENDTSQGAVVPPNMRNQHVLAERP